MTKITWTQLKNALNRNYWSVNQGIFYLSRAAIENETFHYHKQITEKVVIEHREQQLEPQIRDLWHDTDHAQEPRVKTSNPYDGDTEFPKLYFIKWALQRELHICWLDIAKNKRWVPEDICETTSVITHAVDKSGQSSDKKLNPKKERTYLLIIAALLHDKKINWTQRGATQQVQKLVGRLDDDKLSDDSIRKVLGHLKTDDGANELLTSLRKTVLSEK